LKKKTNIYGTPVPWDAVADGYQRTTRNFLAQYAQEALRVVPIRRGARVIDVACGPGTLSVLAAKTATRVDALDFSADMLKFLKRDKRVVARRGDGQKLPYADDTFDAGYSMFGLMFFPDRLRGFRELYRTLKPGARVAVTSWAPVRHSPAMTMMFEAIRQMTPDMAAPAKAIRTLEDPRVFKEEMEQAGFKNVRIRAITKPFPHLPPKKFWAFMVDGSAPIVMLKKKLGPQLWRKKEPAAIGFVAEYMAKKRLRLTSKAWLGTGTKPVTTH